MLNPLLAWSKFIDFVMSREGFWRFVNECSVMEQKTEGLTIESKDSRCIVVFWIPVGGGLY